MEKDLHYRKIIDIIQNIRIEFLLRVTKKLANKQDYSKIIQYLGNPSTYLDSKEKSNFLGKKFDNLENFDNVELRKIAITHLHNAYCKDPQKFGEIFRDGQYIIWSYTFKCAENLVAIEETVNQIKPQLCMT